MSSEPKGNKRTLDITPTICIVTYQFTGHVV